MQDIEVGKGIFKIRLDQLLHFCVFFLICIYYLVGKIKGLRLFEAKSLIKFVILSLILATVSEMVQIWVPERRFNIFDLVANVTGVGIGVAVILVTRAR
jgi:VanZ family protein